MRRRSGSPAAQIQTATHPTCGQRERGFFFAGSEREPKRASNNSTSSFEPTSIILRMSISCPPWTGRDSAGFTTTWFQDCFKRVSSRAAPTTVRSRKARTAERPMQTGLLPPHADTVNAAIQIAAGVMTDRSARHRAWPEHDARPCHAAHGIANIGAVNNSMSRCGTERDACKA